MRRRFSKSGLFLMELVIAIGFFAVASAVCAQLFAEAHSLSRRGNDLSMAMVAAESSAESFKAFPHDGESLAALDGTDEQAWYGGDWQALTGADGSAYRVVVAYTAEERLLAADIAVYGAGSEEPIYQIVAKKAVIA